jgi:hypothetical protein
MLLAFCAGSFAQEYYYWYNGEKTVLELLPSKKFILLQSSEDSIQLKAKFTEEGITVIEFGKTELNALDNKLTDKEYDFWGMVEKESSLPILTDNEEIAYEAPFFLISSSPVALSNRFYVKLKNEEDFDILKNLAEEKKIEIYGNDRYQTLWYVLSCDKNSEGNALQMANFFYESGLFEAAEPELLGAFTPSSINSPLHNAKIYVSNSMLYLDIPTEEKVFIFSLSGQLLYSTSEKQISVAETPERILLVRGTSGWTKKLVVK